MKEVFLISKPARFVTIALATALLSAVFIAPFLDRLPWLIGVPILFGTALVIIGEFWEPISFFMRRSAPQITSRRQETHPVGARSGKPART